MEVIALFIAAGLLATLLIGALFAIWRLVRRNPARRCRGATWLAVVIYFLQLNLVSAQFAFMGSSAFEGWWANLLPLLLSTAMVAVMLFAKDRSASTHQEGSKA